MTSKRYSSFRDAFITRLSSLRSRFSSSVKIDARSAAPSIFTAWNDERGVVGLLGVVLYSAIILVIGATMVDTAIINHRISNKRVISTQTIYHAESGAEDALLQMKRDPNYGATATTLITTFNSQNRAETTVNTPVVAGCATARKIISSGFTGNLVRRVQLTNCGNPSINNISFNYALQSGTHGIQMDNNSKIIGSTYTNGNHTGGNGSSVTGDAWVAGVPAPSAAPLWDPGSPTDFIFGKSSNANVTDVAQSFIADTSSNNRLIKVAAKVRKFGNPSNATVRIVTDDSDKPSNNQIGTGTLNSVSVGLTSQFVDVSMATPPVLTNGTKYWIVIDTGSSVIDHWAWASQDGYANGKGMSSPQWKSSGSMTWNDTGADFAFKAFMGAPPTYLQGVTVGGNAHANMLNSDTITGNGYFQVNNGSTIVGSQFPGSVDPPTKDLPITDANAVDLKNQAAAGTNYVGDYTVPSNTGQSFGPGKITGNLLVGGGATLTMTGTIWVTGTVTFANNSTLRLGPGYGTNSGALVTDGVISLQNNVNILGLSGNHILLFTLSPVDNAIDMSNNAAGIIFAAIHGTVNVHNNSTGNAFVAEGLHLNNNAIVTYIEGLSDINFSGGPGGSFAAQGWHEVVCDNAVTACN